MPITVEANLRIPSLTIRSPNQPSRVVNNGSVRFLKIVHVPIVPKVGSPLDVTVAPDIVLPCTVTRVEWNDGRGIFIVSCGYAKKRITPDEYESLINDSEWTVHQLPV
jgi:hypothetical protein